MLIAMIRAMILYLVLITVIRLLGKRQLGEMEPSEFVVTLLIADLASVPMQDPGVPLLSGIVPILTILVAEVLLSVLSYYSVSFRKLLCGQPIILMENGTIIQNNLKRTRITPDELTEQLREKDIPDLSKVKYVILETNGQISAFLDGADQPLTPRDMELSAQPLLLPVTVISSGKLIKENLKRLGVQESWVRNYLEKKNCSERDVFLMTIDEDKNVKLVLKEK